MLFTADGEFRAVVGHEEHESAPSFENDGFTLRSNRRKVSARTWHSFCAEAGLTRLFYDNKQGLVRRRLGCFVLNATHLEEVQSAMARWRGRYPDAQSRFKHRHEEAHLARLIWLEWWMRYALENYATPAIYNS